MVSPGYSYDKAPDQKHFLKRQRTIDLFRRIFNGQAKRWRFNQSPLFIEFLAGERDYECTPWAMPTYSVFGWQKPCYLLQEGYEKSFDDLLEKTSWENYGHASGNPQCQDCMVHSGFEGSSVNHAFSSLGGLMAMARAVFFGPRSTAPGPAEEVPALAGPPAEASPPPSRGFASEANPSSLRAAFEYRGDVTLQLDGGDSVEGYVANLGDTELDLWKRGQTATRKIALSEIAHIEFSGRDTADGRSYQTWLKSQDTKAAAHPA